ncbi:hypothetical protein DFJ73DRAFT_848276 [Zopfochytrium polystomum]|nr:hypothetical protein DFJ73DRAFT_848276 [Zopfochytrium polystomum]
MFGLYGLDEAESSMRGVRALASCFQGDEDALTTCKLSIKFVFDYLVTKKRSVLSLGSGNGTFEMAICSMRGETWDPTAGNIRVSERYRVNLPGWHVLDAEELDGTVFRTVGLDEDSSILFNCPWTDWHNERKSIRVVLQNFMLSAYRVLERGRFVFLGITELTEPPYFPQYNLAELAKFAKPGFRLRYIDTGFHDLAWSRGYHHHSVGQDIDGLLSGTLVMLCFERI